MFLQKIRVMAAMAVVVLALGAGGLAYRAGNRAAAADRPGAGRPPTELEALRRENELLRLNLEVVLEKVRAQEAELRGLRGPGGAAAKAEPPATPRQRALAEHERALNLKKAEKAKEAEKQAEKAKEAGQRAAERLR